MDMKVSTAPTSTCCDWTEFFFFFFPLDKQSNDSGRQTNVKETKKKPSCVCGCGYLA